MSQAPVYSEQGRLTNVGYECLVRYWGSSKLCNRHYYKDGRRHREDGPAIELIDGHKAWFLNDIKVSEEEFKEVWECPLDRLPLYINTYLAPIMRRRLQNGDA